MTLTKQQREALRLKYSGRCAYCGCELGQRWAADHSEPLVRDWVNGGCQYPERDCFENLTPACMSCNTIKGSSSVESFRRTIANFIRSLNRDSTQYKFAKRYGLIQEKEVDVRFYFEDVNAN